MQTLGELIRAARDGDTEAIETLVMRFSGVIRTECAKYGIRQHPEWSHSDLVQEVVFRVWTKIDQFNGAEHEHAAAMFDQWVRTTAQTVLKNLHRARTAKKRKPEGKIQPIDEATQTMVRHDHVQTASSVFSNKEQAERLNDAMDECLDKQSQEILSLRVVDGLSLKDISERLSLSYDQVRYKFKCGLEALEKGLQSSSNPPL
ncbi:MAG: RNA polymerase sigma factor [Mariniblastus sp.]